MNVVFNRIVVYSFDNRREILHDTKDEFHIVLFSKLK